MNSDTDMMTKPMTVIAARKVELVLVSYTDKVGKEISSLALVGKNNAHLLNSKNIGLTGLSSNSGLAADWLKEGIFEKLKEE